MDFAASRFYTLSRLIAARPFFERQLFHSEFCCHPLMQRSKLLNVRRGDMKSFFVCLLSLSLVVFVAAGSDGAQKKPRARKKGARSELSSKAKRSPTVKSFPEEPIKRGFIKPADLKEPEAIKSANKVEAEISSFIATFDSFTRQLAMKIIDAADAAKGISEAQDYLETRKAEIESRFKDLNCIAETQVSKEFLAQMKEHFFMDGVLIGRILVIYGSEPAVRASFQKLMHDFLELLESGPCPSQKVACL
jgi:hypothetical protein